MSIRRPRCQTLRTNSPCGLCPLITWFRLCYFFVWKTCGTSQCLKAMTTSRKWDAGDFHQAALLLLRLHLLCLTPPLLSSCHISISRTNTHCAHNYEHTSCLTSFSLFLENNSYFRKKKLWEFSLLSKNIIFCLVLHPFSTPAALLRLTWRALSNCAEVAYSIIT